MTAAQHVTQLGDLQAVPRQVDDDRRFLRAELRGRGQQPLTVRPSPSGDFDQQPNPGTHLFSLLCGQRPVPLRVLLRQGQPVPHDVGGEGADGGPVAAEAPGRFSAGDRRPGLGAEQRAAGAVAQHQEADRDLPEPRFGEAREFRGLEAPELQFSGRGEGELADHPDDELHAGLLSQGQEHVRYCPDDSASGCSDDSASGCSDDSASGWSDDSASGCDPVPGRCREPIRAGSARIQPMSCMKGTVCPT